MNAKRQMKTSVCKQVQATVCIRYLDINWFVQPARSSRSLRSMMMVVVMRMSRRRRDDRFHSARHRSGHLQCIAQGDACLRITGFWRNAGDRSCGNGFHCGG